MRTFNFYFQDINPGRHYRFHLHNQGYPANSLQEIQQGNPGVTIICEV